MAAEDNCGGQVMVYDPGQPGRTIPLPELGERIGVPQPGDIPDEPDEEGEVWKEVKRETETVEVSGVTIERMTAVNMRRPNGAIIRLEFNGSEEED